MNVLLVSTKDGGGAGIACKRLHLALLELGISSRWLVLEELTSHVPHTASFRRFQKDKLGNVQKIFRFFKEEWNKKQLTKKLQKYPQPAERFRFPSSVHDLTEHPYYQWADILNLHWVDDFLDWNSFFQKNTKPLLWSLHDMGTFSGGFNYKTGLQEKAYVHFIKQITTQKKKCLKNQRLEIVGLSKWLLDESKSSEILGHFPHHHIPNGINPKECRELDMAFCREVLELPQDRKLLLFTAVTLSNERKGLSYFIKALEYLQPTETDIVLLGGHTGQVDFGAFQCHSIGRVSDFRMINMVYNACDILVMSSIEDNLPNVVLEALFTGMPVVGFDVGGIPDMVQTDENGYLCELKNPKDLARGIQLALHRTWDKKAIRDTAVSNFNDKKQAIAYIEVFKNILLDISHKTEKSSTSTANQ